MTAKTTDRLSPTLATLRELYLKSGNQCAFPACKQALFTDTGTYMGNVCHIEAAEKGGERFNPNLSVEARRDAANLILLCLIHHTETNNTAVYKTDVLKAMKARHESKFADVIGKIRERVVDHTEASNPLLPTNLKSFFAFMGWRYVAGDVDEIDVLKTLKKLSDRLRNVPIPTREFFTILVKRSVKDRSMNAWVTSVDEVQSATDKSTTALRGHFSTLDRAGFTADGDKDDFQVERVRIVDEDGWHIWADLHAFCSKTGCALDTMTKDLDFTSLQG
jgi:hypothetical protein